MSLPPKTLIYWPDEGLLPPACSPLPKEKLLAFGVEVDGLHGGGQNVAAAFVETHCPVFRTCLGSLLEEPGFEGAEEP